MNYPYAKLAELGYGQHNYCLDDERLEKLLSMIRPSMPESSDKEIIAVCIYHYGGTVVEALIDKVYNDSL